VRRLAILPIALAAALAACAGDGDSGGAAVEVVATTTQVADIARNVAGGRADVRSLLRPGGDPHGYEPRPSDAKALAEAEVVLRSGGDVDEWLGDLVEDAGGGAVVVTLADAVHRAGDDPHWWQDPRNAMLAVAVIRDALAEADPQGRAAYERGAARYLERLRALDSEIAACIRRVSARKRRIVTTHDALGYFARRYGIHVTGAVIPSLSTQAQASARDVSRLVRRIRDEGVEAVFPESEVSGEVEEAIARESGAQIGKALWADSLGPPGSRAATYLGATAANAAELARGMSGGAVRCRLPA
jgi:ABC-type Zn uptake system ZnuABC Zn-binding protein ZnuA